LLFHGIPDADIRNGDTLADPLHTEGGELMRFDRVITNPPFSLNYAQEGIPYPERFRYGWCPEGGKKADLMFVQHMISVLRPQGAIATVMPHGVLFRGGAEHEIRKGMLEDDLLDAVIGLAPNLFYGTAIPACILVLRAKGAKPPDRRGKVLFINADAEFWSGRAQNYLLPEHADKIVTAYRAFADIPGYATVVNHAELLTNDISLNIRRYADNTPPLEHHDVRAHLLGGIPKLEVVEKADLFAEHGFDPTEAFASRDADYYEFSRSIATRADLRPLVSSNPGLLTREGELAHAFNAWWQANAESLSELPQTKALLATRATLLTSFVSAIAPVGLLDRFKVAGVIASWWGDVQFDLRALAAGGFRTVIDGWVTTITTALDDKAAKGSPLDHRLVRALLPAYLDELGLADARRAGLHATVKRVAGSREENDENDTADEDSLTAGELAALKKELRATTKRVNALELEFVAKLEAAVGQLSADEERALVLRIARDDLAEHLSSRVSAHREAIVAALENWWDKYGVTLEAIETQRNAATLKLNNFLRELGYE
jgi:type I restriction enzyme M protein